MQVSSAGKGDLSDIRVVIEAVKDFLEFDEFVAGEIEEAGGVDGRV